MKEISEMIEKLKVSVNRLTDDNLRLKKDILRLKAQEQELLAEMKEVKTEKNRLELALETLSNVKETEQKQFQDDVMKDVAGLVEEIDRCIALVEQNG